MATASPPAKPRILESIVGIWDSFDIHKIPIFSIFTADEEYKYFSQEQLEKIRRDLFAGKLTLDGILNSMETIKSQYLRDHPQITDSVLDLSDPAQYLDEVNRYLGKHIFSTEGIRSINAEESLREVTVGFRINCWELLKARIKPRFKTIYNIYQEKVNLSREFYACTLAEGIEYHPEQEKISMKILDATFSGRPTSLKTY